MTPSAPPSPEALFWAHRLGPDVAFVLHPGQVWAASTVMDLVEGIWHAHPDRAHTLLRTRVFTTAPRSDLDHAIVQLCSRKLCAGVPTDQPGADGSPREVVDLRDAAAASRAEHVEASGVALSNPRTLRAAVEALGEGGRLATRARPVVAVLLDADGTVLDAARNTHGTHRLHHAEVNLVQRWRSRHGPTFPPESRVLVSLQCCRMCAALLVDAAPSDGLAVGYLEPEPGRFGRHTALQARGWERRVDPIEWTG